MINPKLMNPAKLPRKEDEDCITDLPDDIMCRIISSLPTVDVVRTSVLSKAWEYKWTSINNIDITDQKRQHIGPKEGGIAFTKFMRRITSRTTDVRKFRLRLVKDYKLKLSETKSWISPLLKNHIENLYVDTAFSSAQVVIPGSLLNTKYLKYMVLVGPRFSVPTTNCFTILKSLRLEHARISKENSGNSTMVLNFPVLETFKVLNCEWFLVKRLEINAPALITFNSRDQNFSSKFDHHTINIHGDKLEVFSLGGRGNEEIIVTGSKVVTATFTYIFREDVEPMVGGGVRIQRILKQFARTLQDLILSFDVAKAILESNQEIYRISFAKLRRLYVHPTFGGRRGDIIDSYGNTEVLLNLLHAMPCLKCLRLYVCFQHFNYGAIESIPPCITSSLEKIEFVDISYDTASLLRLSKFFLKTALVLKEFNLIDHRGTKFEDIYLAEISSYAHPTGSPHVKIGGSQFNHVY